MDTQRIQRPAEAAERPQPRIQRLTIRDLAKRFGELYALRNFGLDVQGGEFISLLGPSGCGKTTALNCLAGLLEPDGGDIEVDGKSIISMPPERREFGMVFQNYALFPHLNVGRNVAFGLEMARVPRPEIARRVEQVLALVQLGQQRDKYPAQLSGGQQQRVALGRAIVTEPRLILMDEPLSNLDAKLRLEMRTEIRRLHQALGLTTIYVTHDQEEALSLSDRIVLMQQGTIEQVGTPREIYAEPASVYAANFLGYRNLVPVQVISVDGVSVTVKTPAGVELTGNARGSLTSGAQAVAAIRPEDIALLPQGQQRPNTIPGSVELVEFLGKDTELNVRNEIGIPLIVRSDAVWRRDSLVTLWLPEERVLIFPEEVR
ncbi:MAG TPA: ABC transporter ATP-binding protein [Roseiflexaceae bacterium]|jgi:putative spermidine/putrescine transport system ATP-binding protein